MTMNFGGKDLRVLVAYDNFISGKRAMALLKRVDGPGGAGGRLSHIMLRFDLMADPAFFELAVNEALAAEIVVIATAEGKDLPQQVRAWIVRWLLVKETRPLALVVTLDHKLVRAGEPPCVSPYLAKLAHYGKMQFFTNGRDKRKDVILGNFKTKDHAFASGFVRSHPAARN